MRLYHFTGLVCLIGDEGLATAQALLKSNEGITVDGSVAGPTSILRAGLKPGHNGRGQPENTFSEIGMPECVWLTRDPSHGENMSSYYDFRIDIELRLNSSRLKAFPAWLAERKLSRLLEPNSPALDWFVYFGVIQPFRFLGVANVTDIVKEAA
jgi:hypothetical protein